MTVFFQLLIFNFVLSFSGRGLLVIIYKFIFRKKFDDELKIFGIPIYLFYSIIFLFFLGNITFLVNFFTKIFSSNLFFLISILFLANIFNKVKIPLTYLIYHVFSIFFISISSYSVGLSYDAGLYHLNTQGWMKFEKLVFGLSNLHVRYGYSSLYDFIGVNFNQTENFIYLHYLNLTFLVFLFVLILYMFLNTDSNYYKAVSILVLVFGILDNFGLGGGKNGFFEIEGITKYDTSFAVILFVTNLFIGKIINQKSYELIEIHFLIFLILFLVQMRPTGLLPALFFLIIILIIDKTKFFKIITSRVTIFFLFLSSFWLLKNLIVSGCLIFPIEALCFENLRWYEANYAMNESRSIRESLRAFNIQNNLNINLNNWFEKNEYNRTSFLNFILSFLIIFIFKKLLFQQKKINIYMTYFYFYSLLLILFWFFTAPDFRFGIGILLTSIISLSLSSSEIRPTINSKNLIFLFLPLFFLCIASVPRLDNYRLFLGDPFKQISVQDLNVITYIERVDSYGVFTENGSEQCWQNIECTPSYSPKVNKGNLFNYVIFEQRNN